MEFLLSNIEWVPTVVSAGVALLVGMIWWYSPPLFKWRKGVDRSWVNHARWKPVAAQMIATFLFAVIMNVAVNTSQLPLAILFTAALAGFNEASGFYSGKTTFSISVEVLHVVTIAAVLWGVNIIL